MIAARVERLSPEARSVAEIAALVGQRFSREVTRARWRMGRDDVRRRARRVARPQDRARGDRAAVHTTTLSRIRRYATLSRRARRHNARPIGTAASRGRSKSYTRSRRGVRGRTGPSLRTGARRLERGFPVPFGRRAPGTFASSAGRGPYAPRPRPRTRNGATAALDLLSLDDRRPVDRRPRRAGRRNR